MSKKEYKYKLSYPIIVIIAIILFIPVFYYFHKFNQKGYAEQKALDSFLAQEMRGTIGYASMFKLTPLDVNISFKNIAKDDIAKIKQGDKEMLSDGRVLAEILWLGRPEENYFITDLGSRSYLLKRTVPDKSLYSIPAKIRLWGVMGEDGSFRYKSKDVKEFRRHIFKTNKYTFDFIVEPKTYSFEEL